MNDSTRLLLDNVENEVGEQTDLIAQIAQTLNEKAAGADLTGIEALASEISEVVG